MAIVRVDIQGDHFKGVATKLGINLLLKVSIKLTK